MSIKRFITAFVMGCVISLGTTGISLAQNVNKSTKIQKSNTKKVNQKSTKRTQTNKKRTNIVVKKNNKRVKAVLAGGVVAAAGDRASSRTNNSSLIYSLMDLNTGQYLEGNNTNKVHSLASLTKLMSSYVFIKNHPNWRNCEITVTEEDRDTLKNTRSRVARNQPHSCEHILEAVLVMSDNWAASSISRNVPNISEKEFIRLMNKQARMWGMKNTTFADPAGVNPRNKSTAADLNILISQVSKDPDMQELSTKRDVVVKGTNGQFKTFFNTNMLVREKFFGATLSKTGYINESGYNLVFVPQFCAKGRHLALVVMGARSSMTRASFAKNLLNKYNCV